jgi:hypothetical protein
LKKKVNIKNGKRKKRNLSAIWERKKFSKNKTKGRAVLEAEVLAQAVLCAKDFFVGCCSPFFFFFFFLFSFSSSC